VLSPTLSDNPKNRLIRYRIISDSCNRNLIARNKPKFDRHFIGCLRVKYRGKKRILVIDDDTSVLRGFRTPLQKSGYTVGTVETAKKP
jgi:hypothetical protein